MVLTGFIYMFYAYPNNPIELGGLNKIAILHTLGAFILLAFVIAHVYLTTTGDKPLTSIKAMLTGWEVLDIDETQERMEHLQDAVVGSSAGYYRLDIQGNIIDVNEAWLKLYKYDNRDEIIGKHFSVTRKQTDLNKLKDIFSEVMEGASISSHAVVRQCKDGSTARHILSANPIFNEKKVVGMEGFILDTTKLDDHVTSKD